jgi:hypothetical protein
MIDLVTAASLECYSIYLLILDPLLPKLSTVVLGMCSSQSTYIG